MSILRRRHRITPKGLLLFLIISVFCGFVHAYQRPVVGVGDLMISQSDQHGLEQDALAGSPEAAAKLANYYGFVQLDFKKQLYWSQVQAENGSVVGQYNFGSLLEQSDSELDKVRGLFWLKRAAQGGSKEAESSIRTLEK